MQATWLRISVLMLAVSSWMLLSGCDDESDSGNLSLSKESAAVGQVGWQMMNHLSTNDQFSEMVEGNELFEDADPELMNSAADVRKEFSKMKPHIKNIQSAGLLSKSTNDSLIWYLEWNDPVSGVAGRQAFYYNQESGFGRFYQTIHQFPQSVQLAYDSTDLQAFLGPSLEDTTDDRLLEIYKLTLFDAGYFVESVEGTVTATAWDVDNEVTAGSASNLVMYGDQTDLDQLQQNVTFNADESFSVSEQLDYRDGTTFSRAVTYADFAGTLAETWRDGSTVTGTFDLLEDDNHAAVSRTITLANHPIVSIVEQAADYTLDPVDSSSVAIVTEKVTFNSGEVDSASIMVDRFMEGGLWKEAYVIETSNKGSAAITVTFFDTFKQFEGNHTNVEGFFTVFNGIEYEDGSGELWLSVYASEEAFLAGDLPLLTAHFVFNGYGGGEGSITEGNTSYNVTFSETGEILVSDDNGNSETLNAY